MHQKIILIVLFLFMNSSLIQAKEYATSGAIKKIQKEYGGRSGERLSNWNKVMKNAKNDSPLAQARKIDKYFNQYRGKSDATIKNVKYAVDTWRTFRNFMGQLGGDCEDYVLSKYYSLVKLGVPKRKLQIWTGWSNIGRGGRHAVLAYFVDGKDPIILDNLTRYAQRFSKRKSFTPYVYFNELKYGKFDGPKKATDDLAIHRYHTFQHWIMRNNKDSL
ncbi:MAG: transglutaminase-like cysteine peptidase [Campylobacterota bacterium]|nr:transglutaminase-like cysteine peptidase [Campylobacterota bacterium]